MGVVLKMTILHQQRRMKNGGCVEDDDNTHQQRMRNGSCVKTTILYQQRMRNGNCVKTTMLHQQRMRNGSWVEDHNTTPTEDEEWELC